jgi:SEC-C motif-containing protein
MPTKNAPTACPCGGAAYATCCGRYIGTALPAPGAEQLMRSRYTAYTLRNEAYLRATWHHSTRPGEPIVSDDEKLQWLGLEVKSALRLRQRQVTPDADGDENRDSVEFVARYKVNGRAHRLHELSRFVREDGRWFYLDGTFPG